MQAKDLAKILKDYRERNEISQIDMAKRLSFTQATISRIEAGKQLPRKAQIRKILDLVLANSELMKAQFESNFEEVGSFSNKIVFNENYYAYHKSEWNCFMASRPHGSATGGDVLLLRELKKHSQIGVLVGDSVGHGTSSAYMSFALEFAYTAIASMLNPMLLNPELFDKAIATGIVKTAKNWRGEPSMIILQLDMEKAQLSLVNRGMPHPILMDGEKANFITEKRASAFSLQNISSAKLSFDQKFEPAQSIFLYSDGLLDLIPENNLLQTMQKLNKVFKGDSRAIGRNLIRQMEKNSADKQFDDVSFTIISRAIKRKKNNVV